MTVTGYITRIDGLGTRYRDNGAQAEKASANVWKMTLATIYGPALMNSWCHTSTINMAAEIETIAKDGYQKIHERSLSKNFNQGMKQRCDLLNQDNLVYEIRQVEVDLTQKNLGLIVKQSDDISYQCGILANDMDSAQFQRPDPYMKKEQRQSYLVLKEFVDAAGKNPCIRNKFGYEVDALKKQGCAISGNSGEMATWLVSTLIDADATNMVVSNGLPSVTYDRKEQRYDTRVLNGDDIKANRMAHAHAPLRDPATLLLQLAGRAITDKDATKLAASIEIMQAIPASLNLLESRYVTRKNSSLTTEERRRNDNRRQYAGHLMGT